MAALAWLLGLSLFGKQGLRQFFALGALHGALVWPWMTGLLYAGEEAIARLIKRPLPPQLRSLLAPGALAILLAVGLLPSYQESDALAHNHTLHDRRNDLMRYMDTSLEPGMYISNYDNHKTFNRAWGGYTGLHDFPWFPEYASLDDKPIEEWRALGVTYAIMPHQTMLQDPEIYYPDDTVLLKTYPRRQLTSAARIWSSCASTQCNMRPTPN